jgi:hypothetical protein
VRCAHAWRKSPVTFTLYGSQILGERSLVNTSEAARHFFQGAMSIWLGAPEFRGSPATRSLNEWFELSLREHLPAIARKRGAETYIHALRGKIESAYEQYSSGETEAGRQSMLELLDLIHTHLGLPSKKQVTELAEKSRSLQ